MSIYNNSISQCKCCNAPMKANIHKEYCSLECEILMQSHTELSDEPYIF